MSSRALSLATVLFLIGFGAVDAALAQATNLEAGKATSQIFAQTCNACHKSPRGLLKTVAPGSLPGFLRQHYTTSSDMAGVLASYLVSNGAADTRYQAKDKKDGAREKDANMAPGQSPEHQGRRQRPQEAAKPEGEGAGPAPEGRRKRAARPSEEGAKPESATDQPPQGRKGKRMGKRGKPETDDAAAPKVEPKVDSKTEPKIEPKTEPKTEPKSESAKVDSGRDESKPDSAKPAEKPAEAKPESAKVEPSNSSEKPALRPDPVPQVTPAPPAAAKPAEPAGPKPTEAAVSKPAEPAPSSEPAAKPAEPVTSAPATAPSPAPAESSGPPAPPISR